MGRTIVLLDLFVFTAVNSDLGNTAKRLPAGARSRAGKPATVGRIGVSDQTRGGPASNESHLAV